MLKKQTNNYLNDFKDKLVCWGGHNEFGQNDTPEINTSQEFGWFPIEDNCSVRYNSQEELNSNCNNNNFNNYDQNDS